MFITVLQSREWMGKLLGIRNFENQTTGDINRFELADASLFYGKEDSAWGFELNTTNLFDIEFKRQNSVNEFIVSDQWIFIQPRIVMLKVIYKL